MYVVFLLLHPLEYPSELTTLSLKTKNIMFFKVLYPSFSKFYIAFLLSFCNGITVNVFISEMLSSLREYFYD